MEEITGYCKKCDKQTKLTVVERNESVNFKGVFWLLLRCDECKECFGLTVDNNLVYTQTGDTGILNLKSKSTKPDICCPKCNEGKNLQVTRTRTEHNPAIFDNLYECLSCGHTWENKPKSWQNTDISFELPEYGYIKSLKKILKDAKRSGFTMYNLKVTGVNSSESDVTISINFE